MRLTPVIDSSSNSLRLVPMDYACMIMTVRTMGIYGLNAMESVWVIFIEDHSHESHDDTRRKEYAAWQHDKYSTAMELDSHGIKTDGMTAEQAELICLFSILNCYLQY